MGATLTYAEVDRLSRDFVVFLREDLKLAKGARVALMMPNVLQYPIALFGALRGGYVVVNCNPFYTPRELEWQLVDSGAEVVLVLENFAAVLQQALPNTKVRTVITTQLGDMLGWGKGALVNFYVNYIKRMAPKWSCSATIWMEALRRTGWPIWRSRRGDDCRAATVTQAIFS
jgi:long-chain acyl-CoA synthetase